MNDQQRTESLGDYASVLMLPAHPMSVRVGRDVMRAWLQFVPHRYDDATVLLMVTELVANAVDYSSGPLVLTVSADASGLMRVEVEDASPGDGLPTARSVDRISDVSRQLKMIRGLADRWGAELRLTDHESATRLVWFECSPVAGDAEE